jgi:hypothetical protein
LFQRPIAFTACRGPPAAAKTQSVAKG